MKFYKIILVLLASLALCSCASKKVTMDQQTFKNENERIQNEETKFTNDMNSVWK